MSPRMISRPALSVEFFNWAGLVSTGRYSRFSGAKKWPSRISVFRFSYTRRARPFAPTFSRCSRPSRSKYRTHQMPEPCGRSNRPRSFPCFRAIFFLLEIQSDGEPAPLLAPSDQIDQTIANPSGADLHRGKLTTIRQIAYRSEFERKKLRCFLGGH